MFITPHNYIGCSLQVLGRQASHNVLREAALSNGIEVVIWNCEVSHLKLNKIIIIYFPMLPPGEEGGFRCYTLMQLNRYCNR